MKYFLGFWSRYRDEDCEPIYTVELFDSSSGFNTEDDVIDWWDEWVTEDEYARDWDRLDLEDVIEVSENELEEYEKDKRYDCRWW